VLFSIPTLTLTLLTLTLTLTLILILTILTITSSWPGCQLTCSDTFSMLNVAARLVFRLRRYDPITNALDVHWLRLPERVDFKVAVMAFRVLHGLAPSYLDQLVRVADLPGRHRLLLSTSQLLHVPVYRLTTVGRRSFLVVASVIWNSLPPAVQSLATLSVFCQHQKSHLFR